MELINMKFSMIKTKFNLSIGMLLIIFLFSFCIVSSQEIKWYFDTKSASYGQSAADDLDNDGKLEIAFGTYRNDGNLYVLNAEDGSLLWKYDTTLPPYDACNDVAPLIYDVDEDGVKDVILAASCTPATYCLNGKSGELKWKCITRGSDSPPVIGDIDGDGKNEILHGEFSNYLICIDAVSGTVKWEIEVQADCWIQTAPTLVDIDGDALLDFIIATWAFNKDKNNIYAFRGKDHSLLWKKAVNDVIYHGTCVADVDKDGQNELFIGSYNDTLYCLNAKDGKTKWTYAIGTGFYAGANPVAGDINNDGYLEIIMPFWSVMTALKPNGEILWQYDIPFNASAFRGAVIADINNDEFADVVFGTSVGELIGLSGKNGSQIFRKDLRDEYGNVLYGLDHAPLIADFDKSGTIDVFIAGGYGTTDVANNFGRAYMLSIGKGKGPDWLMFQKNIHRTSSLEDNSTYVEDILKFDDEIDLTPNPANDFIEISYSPLEKGARGLSDSIKIYNVFGEEFITPALRATPPNEGGENSSSQYSTRIDISGLSAGIYFVKLGNIVRKFIKI